MNGKKIDEKEIKIWRIWQLSKPNGKLSHEKLTQDIFNFKNLNKNRLGLKKTRNYP